MTKQHSFFSSRVNNAGVQYVAPIEKFPATKWDSIIAINLSSAFHTTSSCIGGMKSRGWGRIINIASAHGLTVSAIADQHMPEQNRHTYITSPQPSSSGKPE